MISKPGIRFQFVCFILSSSLILNCLFSRWHTYSNEQIPLLQQCNTAIKIDRAPTDFIKFSEDLDLLKSFYLEDFQVGNENITSIEQIDEVDRRELTKCFKLLEKQILPYVEKKAIWPWAAPAKFNNLKSLKNTFKPGTKGVVICSCDKLFDFTINLIKGLFTAFNFELPILVVYIGEDDLSIGKRAYLHNMNVTTLDITEYFDNSVLKLKGFAVKPFAILAAPFEEVLFLDADTIFIQNPSKMFNDSEYQQEGLLLQKDRALHHWWTKQRLWFINNLPKPLSNKLINSDMYNGLTDHQIDSSLIVINKKLRLFSLLATCKMNMYEEREESFYKTFYGDKESFWLGAEMTREGYTILPLLPGVFGRFVDWDNELICGRQLMFDREGVPFYFNEGVLYDKTAPLEERLLLEVPTHYEYHGRWYEPKGHHRCLYSKGIEFSKEQVNRFDLLINMFKHIKIKGDTFKRP